MDNMNMTNQVNTNNINPEFNTSNSMNSINNNEFDIHSMNNNQKNMTEADSQFNNNNMMNMNQMNNQFNNNNMMNMNQDDNQFNNNNMMNMNQGDNPFNNNIMNMNQGDNHFNNSSMMNMNQDDNQINNNMMNMNQNDNQFNNNYMMNMNQDDNQFNNNNMMDMNQGDNQFNNNMMNINQGNNQFNNNMMNINQDDSQSNNNMINMNQGNNQFNNNMMNMNQDDNQFNNNNMINMNQGDNPFNNNSMMNMNQNINPFNNNSMMNMNQDNNPFNNNSMMNMNQINDQYNNNNQYNFMNNVGRKSVNLKYPANFEEFNLDNNKRGLIRQRTQINTFENKITLFDEEIDAYPYIKEKKKLIIFERNDKKQVRVKVPLSLRNNELYFTAIKYKINEFSDMDLFHDNNVLKNDDSPIDNISDGDKVIIAEILDELNNSDYEKEYLPNLNINDIINIIFKFSSGKKKPMTFSRKTKIKEMLKMFLQENKILEKAKHHYKITYDSETLNFNDDSLIGDIFKADGSIALVDQIEEKYIPGKQLKVSLKNKNNPLLEIKAGTLEQIKSFYCNLEQNILSNKKIKKVIIKGKAIDKKDESTFASYGIRNDFTCNILFMGDQESKEDYKDNDEKGGKGLLKKMSCLII